MIPTVPTTMSIDRRAAWLLRGIGLVYAVAGASLWVQVIGLVGAGGILPIAERAGAATASFGAWWARPSLLWLWPTNAALHAACGAVVAAGGAMALWPGDRAGSDGDGDVRRWVPSWVATWVSRRAATWAATRAATWAPAGCAFVAWAGYLSLVNAGDAFLGYQWDALLCEAGFLAIVLAAARGPTFRILWLYRLLVARLMFASGLVKLQGDAVWRDLSALSFHFFTQPLPTRAAWWAHQLPPGVLRAMTGAALAIELLAPILVFGPRRARRIAAGLFIALQLVIALTGNYGFFNLLTVVLCLSLLGDSPPRASRDGSHPGANRMTGSVVRRALETAILVTLLWLTITPLALAAGWRPSSPAAVPIVAPYVALAPWRLVNAYGLFADMTTTRPELVLEGTLDGVTWQPYPLRWLPGDVARAPRLAGPHMPRLDWQLWFAALEVDAGGPAPPWLLLFLDRLTSREPAVIALLAGDPLGGRQPIAVRAVLFDDRFSDAATRRRTGAWWVRTGGRVVAVR